MLPPVAHGAASARSELAGLIALIEPFDEIEAAHRSDALDWLAATEDVYRRVAPDLPAKRLVCYFLPVDDAHEQVLLADHRKAGLWLPPGGHVEPGEHPGETVRREAAEELGIAVRFSSVVGDRPFFITVTETTGSVGRHTDVSLWYLLEQGRDAPLRPDSAEFRQVRWWHRAAVERADPARFDPHLGRLLTKYHQHRQAEVSSGRAGGTVPASRS